MSEEEKTPPAEEISLPTEGEEGELPPLDIPGISSPPPHVEAHAEAEAAPEPTPEPLAELNPMAPVKALSENMAITDAPVDAGYPFSLQIEGKLSDHERAKLLEILAHENLGLREVDLEPQFEAGRILIPRVSEYAGVLIVQALRGTSAKLRLGPSDEIFSTAETRDDAPAPRMAGVGRTLILSSSSLLDQHPAEIVIVTSEGEVPGRRTLSVVDLLTVSRGLEIRVVEAEKSSEYQDALQALTRELKFKAHIKGAHAVVNFTVELTPLRLSSQYRLTLMGSAVRLAQV